MQKLWKATGCHGQWFARVEGEDEALPCVHACWVIARGTAYHDPFLIRDWSKMAKFISTLQQLKRVVLTTDVMDGSIPIKRKDYVAVYEVEDVKWSDEEGLKFCFIQRVKHLK